MTVHNSSDALAAEMMAIGAAAREAARAMREASDEAKTKALHGRPPPPSGTAPPKSWRPTKRAISKPAKAANMPANMIDSSQVRKIRGRDEMIHRDDLVLTGNGP